jgi:hypothetical protein
MGNTGNLSNYPGENTMKTDGPLHVHRDGVTHGPFSLDELVSSVANGLHSEADYVWDEDANEWVPLTAILPPGREEESGILPPPPPPTKVGEVLRERKSNKPLVIFSAFVVCIGLCILGFAVNYLSQSGKTASPAEVANGPKAGQPWENSLGMKFVPAGTDGVLFGVWDVRVQDFRSYVKATGYVQTGGVWQDKRDDQGNYTQGDNDENATWDRPGFEQDSTHPVVGVDWNEANAFCKWLTKKEQDEGKLGSAQMYRLPTDAEWSIAIGNGKYPWGDVWPPPDGAGNYDASDPYPFTSPVGSFRANSYGLYDMGGNVWQWCEDSDGSASGKILRGSSWAENFSHPEFILSSYHNGGDATDRYVDFGFRIVLVTQPANRR